MIKAIRKTSLIDFPHAVSSVIFTEGCNFSCSYCYNIELVFSYQKMKTIPEQYVFDLLLSRKQFIEHVVISGGEPTIHSGLLDFIKILKSEGFNIKLDTNAAVVDLREFLPYIDYIAVDLKAPLDRYHDIVGSQVNISLLKKNFNEIKTIKHEFRSVLWDGHPLLSAVDELNYIVGDSQYFIQNIKPGGTIEHAPLSDIQLYSFVSQLSCNAVIRS